MLMKRFFLSLLLFNSLLANAQTVSDYFESIRNNAAELTAFFSQMPKGGDLHHHYSGSVYAETYVDTVIARDYFVHKVTLDVLERKPNQDSNWIKFSTIRNPRELDDYKQRLLQKWSVKDYNYVDYPSHRQFFESFNHFSVAVRPTIEQGLREIKNRANTENVSYIETSFLSANCSKDFGDLNSLNSRLEVLQHEKNIPQLDKLLDSVYTILQQRNVAECAATNTSIINSLHTSLAIDDSVFTMRYQSFVSRIAEPIQLFKNLVTAFEAAKNNPLIVGVNIVAPEHNDISMNDYWLHMQMFNFCHSRYPAVKYSMHAGELTLGLVKPEDLTWHIHAAVIDAKANRIGHGVDIAYEKDNYDLLNYMSRNHIAVEINLVSNEFILKVKDDRHPISLYKQFNVPIVICTDDAGVLRTNLTEQFVLLAKRYKQIKYADIKKLVYNSIDYSFIKEPALKQRLLSKLDNDFKLFERKILTLPKYK
jgi:adenosine deaminase